MRSPLAIYRLPQPQMMNLHVVLSALVIQKLVSLIGVMNPLATLTCYLFCLILMIYPKYTDFVQWTIVREVGSMVLDMCPTLPFGA